ncbi:MAG: glutamate-5-semialdehyde dehydrogenase [Actinomycetota bacterium]|nr:glutamate-5-semialdehyde dehydrogenase [Actinomycetota bacterium]
MSEVKRIAENAKKAGRALAKLRAEEKNRALYAMARELEEKKDKILSANELDLESARANKTSAALVDRLTLSEKRISEMAEGLRDVASLRDPVGEIVEGWKLPNGLTVEKVRVPLGVVGIIYEARPNVTVDATGLCIKSGNAIILRGSSSAIKSNKALVEVLSDALASMGISRASIGFIDSTDRACAVELMKLHGLVDVLIPRGGESLIRTVVENSTVPVIETGLGNCHVFVDEYADTEMAERIVVNAKTQRPGVCNACETVLVHKNVAASFLKKAYPSLREKGVTLRGCPATKKIIPGVEEASEKDWGTEYLDLILAVKVVDSLDEAIAHINHYGSGHSDAIITGNYENARRFTEEVDSSAVYVNASTRFTDGGEFGMGAEIGISTQKLHARGPMSLAELTTTKFVICGEGQIRE